MTDDRSGVRIPKRWSVYRLGTLVATADVDATRVNGGLRRADMEARPADLHPVLLSADEIRPLGSQGHP